MVRRRRVTSPVGEPPFQLVDSWIHPDGIADAPRAAEPDTGPGGYLDRLEEAGHGRPGHGRPGEADFLQIASRAVVVEVARVGTSAKSRAPVEVTVCVIPAERVEIITPLERDHTAQWPPLSRQGTAGHHPESGGAALLAGQPVTLAASDWFCADGFRF